MYTQMSNLKPKLFRMNWRLLSLITNSNANRVYGFSHSSFCTMIESPNRDDDLVEVAESPELPIWVRISENDTMVPTTADDDFVPPSLSFWMENYKKGEAKISDKITVSNEGETDVKKITKILVKQFESVDSVVKALNNSNVIPSESLVTHMLKRFDNNWKSGYGVFVWAESHMGCKFSPDMYDLLVDCLGKSKKFDLMWQVVKQMVDFKENYVTTNTMAKVIRRFAKAGLHQEALDAFRRIEQFGVKKDLLALNILVDALAKEKNVEGANDIYQEFKKKIPPNSHTFNALVHGWSKIRDFKKAQSVIEEMKEHGISPDVVTYTSLIESYCGEKNFKKVDQLLEEMQETGCSPNIITYTIIMNAHGKSKELDEALKVYEKMKASNCVLDSSFYSSLIYILSKAGRSRDAREVFDEMESQGVKRDTRTYNTMITSLCYNTREEDALKLLHEMEKSGVKPDFDTYASLLKMCCKLKQMKVLSFLLTHMLDNDVSVGIGTYSLLVRGLSKSGKLKQACLFLEDAVMKGFAPYDTMFTLLEMELDKAGMHAEKNRVQELKLIQPKRINKESTDHLQV